MNGRACQLCGKPLSRIWAGSGGDFCSREHRNQYRLRCGMDRLLEANKHASLMRRRDQLRNFANGQLQCNSTMAPQAFGAVRAAAARPIVPRLAAPKTLERPRLEAGDGHYLTPRGFGSPALARPADPASFRASRRPAPLPPRARRMPTAIPRAEASPFRSQLKIAEAGRRGFTMPERTGLRALLPAGALHKLQPAGKTTTGDLRRPAIPLSLGKSAKVGNAFRVSANTGFPRPSMQLRGAALPAPAARGMKWPESLSLRHAAFIGRALESNSASDFDFPIAKIRLADSRMTLGSASLRSAAIIPLPGRRAYENSLDTRQADWQLPATDAPHAILHSGLCAGQRSVGPGFVPVKLSPAKATAEHRLEHAPFQPQEHAFINISYSWNASR